ncbi:hypothetical protein ACJ73_00029 [Blastomyces percursus]|uniref:Uncharacterized protein n=1 Tax=Blastomyces percursus TaxID=1658174 RepID=A0A1J9RKY5_9EURO|nr:hypothetical protein ACJ73_00029 [Blastomyces percursus]
MPITYDHREWKAGLPVRSAVLKPLVQHGQFSTAPFLCRRFKGDRRASAWCAWVFWGEPGLPISQLDNRAQQDVGDHVLKSAHDDHSSPTTGFSNHASEMDMSKVLAKATQLVATFTMFLDICGFGDYWLLNSLKTISNYPEEAKSALIHCISVIGCCTQRIFFTNFGWDGIFLSKAQCDLLISITKDWELGYEELERLRKCAEIWKSAPGRFYDDVVELPDASDTSDPPRTLTLNNRNDHNTNHNTDPIKTYRSDLRLFGGVPRGGMGELSKLKTSGKKWGFLQQGIVLALTKASVKRAIIGYVQTLKEYAHVDLLNDAFDSICKEGRRRAQRCKGIPRDPGDFSHILNEEPAPNSDLSRGGGSIRVQNSQNSQKRPHDSSPTTCKHPPTLSLSDGDGQCGPSPAFIDGENILPTTNKRRRLLSDIPAGSTEVLEYHTNASCRTGSVPSTQQNSEAAAAFLAPEMDFGGETTAETRNPQPKIGRNDSNLTSGLVQISNLDLDIFDLDFNGPIGDLDFNEPPARATVDSEQQWSPGNANFSTNEATRSTSQPRMNFPEDICHGVTQRRPHRPQKRPPDSASTASKRRRLESRNTADEGEDVGSKQSSEEASPDPTENGNLTEAQGIQFFLDGHGTENVTPTSYTLTVYPFEAPAISNGGSTGRNESQVSGTQQCAQPYLNERRCFESGDTIDVNNQNDAYGGVDLPRTKQLPASNRQARIAVSYALSIQETPGHLSATSTSNDDSEAPVGFEEPRMVSALNHQPFVLDYSDTGNRSNIMRTPAGNGSEVNFDDLPNPLVAVPSNNSENDWQHFSNQRGANNVAEDSSHTWPNANTSSIPAFDWHDLPNPLSNDFVSTTTEYGWDNPPNWQDLPNPLNFFNQRPAGY